MKLPTSDKKSSYVKPHIRKGYYPAKLLKVEEFKDAEGNLREGQYGRQLIFEFAIYAADPESGAPIKPMVFKHDNITEDVVIPKFVYHQYKNKKTNEYQTAITPNSAITKILKALGWEFSAEGVDIDNLIGHWVEANIDDYDQKQGDETYTASTIKDINPYKGPEVDSEVPDAKKREPQKVEKQVKHEAVKEDKPVKEVVLNEARAAKAKKMKELLDAEQLSQDGYNKVIESLKAEQEAEDKKGE